MSQDRAALIADCDHPQLEYVGDPDPLTDLKCVKCPWQHSIDFIDPYTLPYLHEEGDEHRHEGVTDIHEGGHTPHTHDHSSEGERTSRAE